jgi:hypothetical protein
MAENLIGTATERLVEEPRPIAGEPRRLKRRQLIVRRFVRNKTAVVGLIFVVFLVVVGLGRAVPHQLDV